MDIMVRPKVEDDPETRSARGGLPLGVPPYYGSGRVRTDGGREGPGGVLNLALRRWGGGEPDPRGWGFPAVKTALNTSAVDPPAPDRLSRRQRGARTHHTPGRSRHRRLTR